MIEEQLSAYLSSAMLTSAIIGDRVYPSRLPQGVTLPAVTYRKISGMREYTQSGPAGIAQPRFQVTCWADSYLLSKQLANAVRQDLEGSARQVGDALFLQNEIDLYEPEAQIDTVVLDFLIGHRE